MDEDEREWRYQVVSRTNGRKHTTRPLEWDVANREADSLALNPTVESVCLVKREFFR